MYLNRSIQFLKARKTREIPLPELGDGYAVIIRELSVSQMTEIDRNLVKQLAMMIIDAEGNQVYRTEEDLANLAEMPAWISTRIFEAANEMSGVSPAAREEILKN